MGATARIHVKSQGGRTIVIMSKILVIVGPSGVGKSTLARNLEKTTMARIWPTVTTRMTRADEAVGHIFATDKEFDLMKDSMLGEVTLPGLSARYGLSKQHMPARENLIILARPSMVPALRAALGPILIYGLNTPKNVAEKRIQARNTGPTDNAERMKAFDQESLEVQQYSHRVFDGTETEKALLRRVTQALCDDGYIRQRALTNYGRLPLGLALFIIAASVIATLEGMPFIGMTMAAVAFGGGFGSNK